jgi:hypothetical protein
MTRRDRAGLAVMSLLFLGWHVPLMYRTEAGQDEDWYGVPGIAILRTGVPQIPYLPARQRGSACFYADTILYALPPLAFYLQALVHAVLGLGIGPARMTAALAGLAACYLVYDLTSLWSGDRRSALLAAAAYLLARAFFFPATMARPDMVAVAFGLLAVRSVVDYRRDLRRRNLIVGGVAAGLSLLAHPFGVVPTMQAGLAVFATPADLRTRLRRTFDFGAMALLVLAFWLPLIALHPGIFRVQFGANVLERAGPGLMTTLRMPWPVLSYQLRQVAGYVLPLQSALYILALGWGVLANRRAPGRREFAYHLLASWLLLFLFEGQHPTLGYYAYPAAFSSISLGMFAGQTASAIERRFGSQRRLIRTALASVVPGALLLAFLPGAGLRALVVQMRHANDPAYDARSLARRIMADIPPQAITAVDGAYVLDFYLADRPTLEATIHPLSYDVRTTPFDYIVFARDGLRRFRPMMNDVTLVRTYGDRSDLFAPYAELYRRAPRPPQKFTVSSRLRHPPPTVQGRIRQQSIGNDSTFMPS